MIQIQKNTDMAEETKLAAAEGAAKKTPAKKAAKKTAPKAAEGAAATSAETTPAVVESADATAPADAVPEKKEVTAKDLLNEGLDEPLKIRRAKGSKNITAGIVHVLATFNNTKVVVTDKQGNVITWSSSGKCNFRGSRKSTAYAATVVTQDATRRAVAHGLKEVDIHLKGPGMGRDSAVRALQALGIQINVIIDVTPVPHNGCRPPKRRRV